MRSLADLIRKLSQLSAPTQPGREEPVGKRSLLDGRSAVVHLERLIGSMGSIPHGGRTMPFAAAAGLACNGLRTVAYLGDQDPLSESSPMAQATARHLPMVVHLACRATTSHGVAIGSGHEAYHGLADTGFVLLFAANVQEAVDFTLVARHLAELSLVPVLVAMDEDQTAGALQDIYLPDGALVEEIIGGPDDSIESPTPSQALLFGDHRRRVPRRFDLDVPSLSGSLYDRASWGLAAAADSTFFSDHVPMMLQQAMVRIGNRTGRTLATATTFQTDDAELIIAAQGSTVETAEAVAQALRTEKRKVGVLGIRSCRPFPSEITAAACRGKREILVLERMTGRLGMEGPLTREIVTVLARRGNGKPAEATHLSTAYYGLGGLPLRASDLAGYCRESQENRSDRVFLGIEFTTRSSEYPKREALIDQVRRDYPEGSALGFTAKDASFHVLPPDALSAAVIRGDDTDDGGFSPALSSVIHEVAGGKIRTRLQTRWEDWGATHRDIASWGGEDLRDPGEEPPVDLTVFVEPVDLQDSVLRRNLALVRKGGSILVGGRNPGEQIERIAEIAREEGEKGLKMHYLPAFQDNQGREIRNERLLGAAAAIIGRMRKSDPLDGKKLASVREAMLSKASPLSGFFRSGLKDVQRVEPQAHRDNPSVQIHHEAEAPAEVRQWRGGAASPLDNLPRFWDQVGVLYRRGDQDKLTADPFLASASVPALSASFHTTGDSERTFPEYDPSACTACGECWTHCPDGAIGAAVMPADELLKKAMAEAKEAGQSADGLKRILGKLSKGFQSVLAGKSAPATIGKALQTAFDSLLEKSPPTGDQKAPLVESMTALMSIVKEMPVATPENLGGALLSLSISPDRCKGCATCVDLCEPGALEALMSSAERKEAARPGRTAWEKVAGTTAATREDLVGKKKLGQAAALFLSREATCSFTGSDGAEQGSGARSALRLILAAAEDHMRPILEKHAAEIGETEKIYAQKIRETLSDALPTKDLDLLADGIAAAGGKKFDLSSLARSMEEACDEGTVDGSTLAELVDTGRALAEVRSRLEGSGRSGSRAPHGMVIASEAVARWAAVYPHNPFAVPTAVDTTAHSAALAEGLAQGQISIVADDIRLLRRSRELLDRKGGGAGKQKGLSSWRDWTEEERQLCPPLILVYDDEALERHGRAHLSSLLHSELPIKVVHLSSLDTSLGGRVGEVSSDTGLIALAHRGCFTLQGSVAHPDHLVHGVTHALRYPGPAFIRVHTPSPIKDGFPTNRVVEQARLAVWSRAFPLFLHDPCGAEEGIALVNLDGNPSTDKPWSIGEKGTPFTYADWAATESRFARHYRPLPEDAARPTPAGEYLQLPGASRKGLTPFVALPGDSGDADAQIRLEVGNAMIEAADEHLKIWKLLREFGGLGREELDARHKNEIAAAKSATVEEMTGQMKERLRALAGVGVAQSTGNGGK